MRSRSLESMIQRQPRAGALRREAGGRNGRRGFSLVEVMLALTVLTIGVLGATAGQLTAIKLSSDSRKNTLASYLVDEQMEVFQSMSAADVIAMLGDPDYPDDPNNPIDPNPTDGVLMAFDRSWTITQNTPEAGVATIEVSVNWTNALGRVRTTKATSLRATN